MVAVSAGRVFSDEELAEAGELTVDLIERRLQRGLTSEALALVERFQQEIMTMFFSYIGWEKSILEAVAELDGESQRDQVLAAVGDWEVAPETGFITKVLESF